MKRIEKIWLLILLGGITLATACSSGSSTNTTMRLGDGIPNSGIPGSNGGGGQTGITCGTGTVLDSATNMCIVAGGEGSGSPPTTPQRDPVFDLLPATPANLIATTGQTTIINSPSDSLATVTFGTTIYYFSEQQPPDTTTTNIRSVTQGSRFLEATNVERILEVSKSGDATNRHFLYINDDIDFEHARLARFTLLEFNTQTNTNRAIETALVDTSTNLTETDDAPSSMVTYAGFLVGAVGTNNINQTRLGDFNNMTVDFATTDGTGTVTIPRFEVRDGFADDGPDDFVMFTGTWNIDNTMGEERIMFTGNLSFTLSLNAGSLSMTGQFYGDQAKEFVALGSGDVEGNDTAFGIIGATLSPTQTQQP